MVPTMMGCSEDIFGVRRKDVVGRKGVPREDLGEVRVVGSLSGDSASEDNVRACL